MNIGILFDSLMDTIFDLLNIILFLYKVKPNKENPLN